METAVALSLQPSLRAGRLMDKGQMAPEMVSIGEEACPNMFPSFMTAHAATGRFAPQAADQKRQLGREQSSRRF